jgi:hypothetical protein
MKPGDIVTVSGQRFVLYAIAEGIAYGIDFETGQIDTMFILTNTEFEVEIKPDNVSWLFIKRRDVNSKFIKKYRGF